MENINKIGFAETPKEIVKLMKAISLLKENGELIYIVNRRWDFCYKASGFGNRNISINTSFLF